MWIWSVGLVGVDNIVPDRSKLSVAILEHRLLPVELDIHVAVVLDVAIIAARNPNRLYLLEQFYWKIGRQLVKMLDCPFERHLVQQQANDTMFLLVYAARSHHGQNDTRVRSAKQHNGEVVDPFFPTEASSKGN